VQALRQKAEQEGRQVVIVSAQVRDYACMLQLGNMCAVMCAFEVPGHVRDVVAQPPATMSCRRERCPAMLQVESELKDLEPEDAAEYLESLGATEGGLNR
jgi:hypothetical protein